MNTHSSGYYSIDEEYTIIGMQAQEQGLTTVMEIEPEVYENPYIYGSPLHLIRAMMNIYSNCIKYNKENGEIRSASSIGIFIFSTQFKLSKIRKTSIP